MAVPTPTLVGSAATKSTGTTVAVTVPAAGVALDSRVLVAFTYVTQSGTVGQPFTCADSRGNTYAIDAASEDLQGICRTILFSTHVTTALLSGDTITVTHPSLPGRAMVAESTTAIPSTAPVHASATAHAASTTPSASVTPGAAGQLVYGRVGVSGPTGDGFTQDADTLEGSWTGLTRAGTSGGAATSNQTLNGAAKAPTGTAMQTYNPTLGTSREWAEVLVVYMEAGAGGDTTPPTTTLGNQTRTTISRVPGWDAFDVTITTDEPFVEYELRRVPASTSTRTEGSQIETATVASTTSLVVTVTDDELVNALASEGENTVKAFTKDAALNWST